MIKGIIRLSFVFVLFLFASCQTAKEVYLFTSFHEPADEGLRYLYSEDGYHWDSIPGIWLKPQLGSQRLMRDPSITKGKDGKFHLVWTTSWNCDKGFGYASSKDLMNWSEQKMIPVMQHEPTTINVWAPEVFFDDGEDLFYIVWASTIPFRFEKGIEEENNNHRLYYVTTKDFNTFSDTKLYLDPKFSVIDAVIVKSAPKNYIIVLKDNTRPNRNLKIAFGDSPTTSFNKVSAPFTEEFVEGPTVTKVGNDYLIYFDMYRKKIYGAMKTADFINFEDVTDKISIPTGHKHGTIVKVPYSLVEKLIKTKNK